MLIKKQVVVIFNFYLMLMICMQINMSYAQDKTGATKLKTGFNKRKEAPKQKKLLYIVKNDGREILYGNKCFLDVQHAMGFEFLIQLKDQPLNRNELARNLHNFGIKFVLLFRNGPFWGITLRKRKKKCRRLSADFVG